MVITTGVSKQFSLLLVQKNNIIKSRESSNGFPFLLPKISVDTHSVSGMMATIQNKKVIRMKLSEALELCIDQQFYSTRYEGYRFMCHALAGAGLSDYIPAVMAMVKSIDPTGYALASVLNLDGKGLSSLETFEVCKAHYIKWIAELKEQGM